MCGGAGVLPMDEKMMKRLSSCSGLNGWILLEGFDCEMFFMSQYILATRTLKEEVVSFANVCMLVSFSADRLIFDG